MIGFVTANSLKNYYEPEPAEIKADGHSFSFNQPTNHRKFSKFIKKIHDMLTVS